MTAQSKAPTIGVVVSQFQPYNEYLECIIERSKDRNDRTVVYVTGSNVLPNPEAPYDHTEIVEALRSRHGDSIEVYSVRDYAGNDEHWFKEMNTRFLHLGQYGNGDINQMDITLYTHEDSSVGQRYRGSMYCSVEFVNHVRTRLSVNHCPKPKDSEIDELAEYLQFDYGDVAVVPVVINERDEVLIDTESEQPTLPLGFYGEAIAGTSQAVALQVVKNYSGITMDSYSRCGNFGTQVIENNPSWEPQHIKIAHVYRIDLSSGPEPEDVNYDGNPVETKWVPLNDIFDDTYLLYGNHANIIRVMYGNHLKPRLETLLAAQEAQREAMEASITTESQREH